MKIICIKHKDSSVFKYRFDRPLIEGMKASYRRRLIRKNEVITIGELAQRYDRNCDAIVIKYIDNAKTLDAIYSIRNNGKFKVIVDIDDNIWQIPLGNPARGNILEYSNRAIMMIESVKAADWVTVSTEPLKRILSPINSNIEVLPNYIDPSEWNFKRNKHSKVRIGWVWSPTHVPDMPEVEEALEEIAEKYKGKVEIVVFGTDKNIFRFDTTNIPAVRFDEYPGIFTEAGIDISIAPLADNEFNKCKSDIKFLESAMAGAAFIGSKVYPYEHSVSHGKTGYVCNGKNQWVRHLSNLIDNPDKRKDMASKAKEEVLRRCEIDKGKWLSFYNETL